MDKTDTTTTAPVETVPAAVDTKIDESTGKPLLDQTVADTTNVSDTPAESTIVTGAPEAYADFKLPEGLAFDKTVLDSFVPLFKEFNMTQEQAQKFVDHQTSLVQAGTVAQEAAYQEQVSKWAQQAKADKEIGEDSNQSGRVA